MSGRSRPAVYFNRSAIAANARAVLRVCRDRGIEPYAVIKGYNALPEINALFLEAGYGCLASSRLHHLRRVKEQCPAARTLSLRVPMPSEAAELVRAADVSLCSEMETIRALDAEAGLLGKTHGVILMRDLGDLREGIWGAERFVEAAIAAAKNFRRAALCGIGANLSCYGTVKPSAANMADLADCAAEIERVTGRRLGVVSGGGTTSLPLVARGEMPRAVNNLRIGAGLMLRSEIYGLRDGELPEVTDDTMLLEGEIAEIGEKPTHPVGELDRDCFGNVKVFEDRGARRRAILAFGAFDVGDATKLTPLDPDARVLGASSDHTIVDIHDSRERYALGGKMRFRMAYQPMLFATANESVAKIFE